LYNFFMDGPKHDTIEISAEGRAKWEAEEGWKTAPGIEEKDPGGHFRALDINPYVYETLTPEQQKERREFSYRKLANAVRARGGKVDEMKRANIARDALSGKNQGPQGKQRPVT